MTTCPRVSLFALAVSMLASAAVAQQTEPVGTAASASPATEDLSTIVVTGTQTRTSVALPGAEMQKILPGVSPLKAIQTLPGVLYITADPWGYNEPD